MNRTRYLWPVIFGMAAMTAGCSEDPAQLRTPDDSTPTMAVSAIGTINNPTVDNRLDLTTVNNTEEIDGACFIASPTGSATGTGLYKPFKRVNVNRTWFQAWNTGTRPIIAGNDAEANANWTIDIRLSEIPAVASGVFTGCDNGPYREVRMDINQANPLELAINQIRVYVHLNKLGAGPPASTLVWSLDNWSGLATNTDPDDDHTIVAKKLASGSGRDDLIMLIPESAFPAAALAACPYDQGIGQTCNYWFTFFSEAGSAATGGQNPHDPSLVQSSGFEEWGVVLRPIPPRITLKKIIINDNGGEAGVADFNIVTNAGTPVWNCATVGDTTTCTSQVFSVVAGTVTFSEANVAGYTEGSWTCTRTEPSAAGPLAAGAYNAGSRAVADGEAWTCEITNNDDQGSIKLVKYVQNDNGGTATVAAFDIKLNGVAVAFGAGVAQGGGVTKYETAVIPVDADTHAFTEIDVAGYTEGSWSCTRTAPSIGAATPSGAYNAGSLDVDNGEAWTCEITNNDDPGRIILIKRVDNLYGGTATAADFGIQLNGNPVAFGAGTTVGTVTSYSTGEIQVNKGIQNFLETDVAGYTEGSWSCTRSVPSAAGPVAAGAYGAGSQAVDNGETWTCEITNTEDQPPTGTQTAWAANGLDCCTLRFNPDGGNWATYVEYAAGKVVGFFAGQFTDVGTVEFSDVVAGHVTITITLTGGWTFAPGSIVAVQGYSTAPSGNPSPGLFANKEPASGTSHTITVPAANYYAVHAVVQ
jgi:hypothetical protein